MIEWKIIAYEDGTYRVRVWGVGKDSGELDVCADKDSLLDLADDVEALLDDLDHMEG